MSRLISKQKELLRFFMQVSLALLLILHLLSMMIAKCLWLMYSRTEINSVIKINLALSMPLQCIVFERDIS